MNSNRCRFWFHTHRAWRFRLPFAVIFVAVHLGNAFGLRSELPGEKAVKLPPFVVSELPDSLPWRYGRIAGIEVLTLASDGLTESFAAGHLRANRFVCSAFLGQRDVPVVFVLFNNDSEMLPSARESGHNSRWPVGTMKSEGEVIQSEGEVLTFAANLFGVDRWPMIGVALTRSLMAQTSGIPRWLSVGLFGPSGCLSEMGGYHDVPAVELPSFLWVSEEVSKQLRDTRFKPPMLLPMEKLFASAPDRDAESDVYRVWSSQAGLFARWQLFGKNGRPIDPLAFWGFALEARTRPVDETLFRHWFKQSYADAERAMLNYLRLAIAAPEIIEVAEVNRPLPELSGLKLRMATEEQVARLKGNFERMEAKRLRRNFPELAEKYAAAARHTFRRGLKAHPASGVLRGLLGQLEFDLGNAAAAQPLLEYAFTQNALGTGGLLALAQLRLDESRQGLPDEAKLPGAALERVLTPLFAARERKPPTLRVYQMIAEVWAQSAVTPTKRHLAVLLEGAQFFRAEVDYIIAAVELYQRNGYETEANALIALGETWAADATSRSRYSKLRTRILRRAEAQRMAGPNTSSAQRA